MVERWRVESKEWQTVVRGLMMACGVVCMCVEDGSWRVETGMLQVEDGGWVGGWWRVAKSGYRAAVE